MIYNHINVLRFILDMYYKFPNSFFLFLKHSVKSNSASNSATGMILGIPHSFNETGTNMVSFLE